jgi:hypothetical protein
MWKALLLSIECGAMLMGRLAAAQPNPNRPAGILRGNCNGSILLVRIALFCLLEKAAEVRMVMGAGMLY